MENNALATHSGNPTDNSDCDRLSPPLVACAKSFQPRDPQYSPATASLFDHAFDDEFDHDGEQNDEKIHGRNAASIRDHSKQGPGSVLTPRCNVTVTYKSVARQRWHAPPQFIDQCLQRLVLVLRERHFVAAFQLNAE